MFCDTQCCINECENKGEIPINYSRYHKICEQHFSINPNITSITCCYCYTECHVIQAIISQKPLCVVCEFDNTYNEYTNLCKNCYYHKRCPNCFHVSDSIKTWECGHGFCEFCKDLCFTCYSICRNCFKQKFDLQYKCEHLRCDGCLSTECYSCKKGILCLKCKKNEYFFGFEDNREGDFYWESLGLKTEEYRWICKICRQTENKGILSFCKNCGLDCEVFKRECSHYSCQKCFFFKCSVCGSLPNDLVKTISFDPFLNETTKEMKIEKIKSIKSSKKLDNHKNKNIFKRSSSTSRKNYKIKKNQLEPLKIPRSINQSPFKFIKNRLEYKGNIKECLKSNCKNIICAKSICNNRICGKNHPIESENVSTCERCFNSKIKNYSECQHKYCKECFLFMNKTCQMCFTPEEKCKTCLIPGSTKIYCECLHLGCIECLINEKCFDCIFKKKNANPKKKDTKNPCNNCGKNSSLGFILNCYHFICKKCSQLNWNYLNYRCKKCFQGDFKNPICFNCKNLFVIQEKKEIYDVKCCKLKVCKIHLKVRKGGVCQECLPKKKEEIIFKKV